MSVAAAKTSVQSEREWLMRPLNWAYECSACGSIFAGVGWLNGIDPSIVAGIALGTILATMGLLAWGIRRIHLAARGRY